MSQEDGSKFANKHEMMFMEASAKTTEGVQMAFEELVVRVKTFFEVLLAASDLPRWRPTNLCARFLWLVESPVRWHIPTMPKTGTAYLFEQLYSKITLNYFVDTYEAEQVEFY